MQHWSGSQTFPDKQPWSFVLKFCQAWHSAVGFDLWMLHMSVLFWVNLNTLHYITWYNKGTASQNYFNYKKARRSAQRKNRDHVWPVRVIHCSQKAWWPMPHLKLDCSKQLLDLLKSSNSKAAGHTCTRAHLHKVPAHSYSSPKKHWPLLWWNS